MAPTVAPASRTWIPPTKNASAMDPSTPQFMSDASPLMAFSSKAPTVTLAAPNTPLRMAIRHDVFQSRVRLEHGFSYPVSKGRCPCPDHSHPSFAPTVSAVTEEGVAGGGGLPLRPMRRHHPAAD